MVRRSRAAQTKSRLWEITLERSEKGTSSLDVVKVFKDRFPELEQQERDDLIDLGLMALAGRVAVSSRPDNGQIDIFFNHGYPDFIPVKVSSGNRTEVLRKLARNITPREYFQNVSVPVEQEITAHKLSKHQLFHRRMEEMREKQLLDITLPEYLERNEGE